MNVCWPPCAHASMHQCMHACLHAVIHACRDAMHACIHACIHARMGMHGSTHARMDVCIRVYVSQGASTPQRAIPPPSLPPQAQMWGSGSGWRNSVGGASSSLWPGCTIGITSQYKWLNPLGPFWGIAAGVPELGVWILFLWFFIFFTNGCLIVLWNLGKMYGDISQTCLNHAHSMLET